MSLSLATVGIIAGIVAAAAAVAGVSYTIYSAENPPKTPEQASQALNRNQLQIGKLRAKRDQYAASGKDTSKIDAAIEKVNASMSFLSGWIAKFGDTKTPSIADQKFAKITDTRNPFDNQPSNVTIPGAPMGGDGMNLWTMTGIFLIVVVVILFAINLFKKGK